MRASKKSRQKLRAELKRIETLHREWNALSVTERAWIARATPDLSLFFRRRIETEAPGATAQIMICLKSRGVASAKACPKARLGVLPRGRSIMATQSENGRRALQVPRRASHRGSAGARGRRLPRRSVPQVSSYRRLKSTIATTRRTKIKRAFPLCARSMRPLPRTGWRQGPRVPFCLDDDRRQQASVAQRRKRDRWPAATARRDHQVGLDAQGGLLQSLDQRPSYLDCFPGLVTCRSFSRGR